MTHHTTRGQSAMNRTVSNQTRVLGMSLLGLAMLAAVSHSTAAAQNAWSAPSPPASTASPTALEPDSTPLPAVSSVATTTPTWAALYSRYLAEGTVGDCASCHAQAATPDGAYAWLAQQQYMAGSPPYLVDPRSSCFSWIGGDMPPDGPTSYTRARREFEAWARASESR
jgi:hypothetical protein